MASYLERLSTPGRYDGSYGKAVSRLGPTDSNEVWVPSLVTVNIIQISTSGSSGQPPQQSVQNWSPHCSLYKAPVNAVPPAATFDAAPSQYLIDETYLGANDTTSIVSGMTLQRGQEIVAVWEDYELSPLTVFLGTMTMYGRVYTQAEYVQQIQNGLPLVPGARFSGNPGNAAVTQLVEEPSLTLGGSNFFVVTNPIEVNQVTFRVVTTATVGNRFYGFEAVSDTVLLQGISPFAHAASLTYDYRFEAGGNNFLIAAAAGVPGLINVGIPAGVRLPDVTQFLFTNVGTAVGADAKSQFSMAYKKFVTSANPVYLS